MNIYHQMIENALFFKWIYHPSPEINTYWEHYLEQHPEDARIIREFKAGFEKHLNYKKHQLSDQEKKELALRILKQIDQKDQQNKTKKLVLISMRYAAVALFFLLIGSGLTFLIFRNQPNEEHFVSVPSPANLNIQEPTLILDDKEEIALNKGESELEYSEKGEITVDQQKVSADEEDPGHVKMNTLVIPYGNRSTVLLADGTKVWLNAGSRFIYPSRFTDKNREVFLVGEAFFDVAKNEEKPFLVKTPDIKIEVVGTSFNLSAYPEENIVQTVLTEGSIKQSWLNEGFFDSSTEIKPGQLLLANKKEKATSVYDVSTDYYTTWKEGYLMFSNSDLNRVVKKLERYYNIRFRYDDPMDGAIRISGKLDVTSEKEVVFSYMNSLTGLNFTKINETYYMIK